MVITREQLIRILADKSGYYQRDIRALLHCLDEVIPDLLSSVPHDKDEKLYIQLFEGTKLSASFIPKRERVDPRDRTPIICPDTVKLGVKYSEMFKDKVQDMFEEKAR